MRLFAFAVPLPLSALSLLVLVPLVPTPTPAEAKTSMMFCASPEGCAPHLYQAHAGYGAIQSICSRYKPCYFSAKCSGEDVCSTLQPPARN